jgi:hypothetical protein
MGRRRAALAVVAALLPAASAGCGAGGERPDPNTIKRATAITATRGGHHVEFRGKITIEGAPAPIGFTGTGHEDPIARRSDYRVDLGDFALIANWRGSPPDFVARVLQLGPRAYISLPFTTRALRRQGIAGRWLVIDLSKASQDPSSTGPIRPDRQSPGQLFEYARAARAEKRVGRETIDGVDVVHYRGRVLLDEVAAHVPANERVAVQTTIDQVKGALGSDSVPVDVWIDGSALVRRLRLRYKLSSTPTGERIRATIDMTADLSRFGERVRVSAPTSGLISEEETSRLVR